MLAELFQEVWDAHADDADDAEPLDQHKLRDEAFKLIEDVDYGDALYEALKPAAYAFLIAQRNRKSADADDAAQATTSQATTSGSSVASARAGAIKEASPKVSTPAKRTAGVANSRTSSKYASLRKTWPMLQGSYSVAHGIRKNLESMTAEECLAAASTSRKLAEGNIGRAEWLEQIAQAQIKHKAATVAKLPPKVLTELQESAP